MLDATVNKHTQEAKEKYSISEESNKFANQLHLTPKEINIKYKEIEATKNMKKKAKAQGLNQLLNACEQKPRHLRFAQTI